MLRYFAFSGLIWAVTGIVLTLLSLRASRRRDHKLARWYLGWVCVCALGVVITTLLLDILG